MRDHNPTARAPGTSDDLFRPSTTELATRETSGERRKSVVSGIAHLITGVLVVLLLYSASTFASHHQGQPAGSDYARTAVATSCQQYGPVSRAGLGYWWQCTADVDGAAEPVRVSNSELTPADIGEPVDVYAEQPQNGGPAHYYRDIEHPLRWLGITLAVVAFIALLGFGGKGLLRLVPLATRMDIDKDHAERLREQYRRDGRL